LEETKQAAAAFASKAEEVKKEVIALGDIIKRAIVYTHHCL